MSLWSLICLYFIVFTMLYHLLRVLTDMHTCIYMNTHTCIHTECVSFICGLYHEAVRS
jgi:hypothetical protein